MDKFVDLTGRHEVTAVGNPRIDGDSTAFSSGNYLVAAGGESDFAFPVGPFTVEYEFKAQGGGAAYSMLGTQTFISPAFYGWYLALDGQSSIRVLTENTSINVDPGYPLNDDAWHSVALQGVSGSDLQMYIDGVRRLNYVGTGMRFVTPFALRVGSGSIGQEYHLRNVRITHAKRFGGASYTVASPIYGAADPYWSSTVFALALGAPPIPPINLHDDLLRRLLPPLSLDRLGPNVAAELRVYGAALDVAAAAAEALLAESDPRASMALLTDWERNYGLEPSGSIDVRRAALLAQILAGGGQSRAFYVQLAVALGYAATITEFSPHTVMSAVTEPLRGGLWRYIWLVRAHASAGAVSQAAFEALFNKIKPAHTRVVFEYY